MSIPKHKPLNIQRSESNTPGIESGIGQFVFKAILVELKLAFMNILDDGQTRKYCHPRSS